jgi:hypothetical protein
VYKLKNSGEAPARNKKAKTSNDEMSHKNPERYGSKYWKQDELPFKGMKNDLTKNKQVDIEKLLAEEERLWNS